MKTTKTKPLYLPATKQIGTCAGCNKRYICFSNMVEFPTCPYCNKKVDKSVSLSEYLNIK